MTDKEDDVVQFEGNSGDVRVPKNRPVMLSISPLRETMVGEIAVTMGAEYEKDAAADGYKLPTTATTTGTPAPIPTGVKHDSCVAESHKTDVQSTA